MKKTTIFKGVNCVKENLSALAIPSKCLIVTGKSSAAKSGALSDITDVLTEAGTEFIVYNGITENPLSDSCREAGKLGHDFGAELVIGIGGGSPLDAAKAAAVFAMAPELSDDELLAPGKVTDALPVYTVPLTAGTGSEVNATAVMTVKDETGDLKKKSFSSSAVLPLCAFLDPRYLKTLNRNYTISTAIDAFCHCYESFLSPKSTPESEHDALEGGRIIWRALVSNDFIPNENDAAGLSSEPRLTMLEGAAYGGRAIMITGTGFTHPLGYGLSIRYGIPHGFACGAFTGKYTEYNMKIPYGKERIEHFAEYIGASPDLIAEVIPALSDINLSLTEEELLQLAAAASGAKNYKNSPAVIDDGDAEEILRALFG